MANIFLYDKITDQNKEIFQDKVRKIAKMLSVDPDWLMIVMFFESRLNPQAKNKYTNATGLIQFMPATAKYLGTTVEALAQMTGEQQLDFVYKYLKTYIGRMKSLTDVYLTVFYPYAVGKDSGYILGSQAGDSVVKKIAEQNPIFDTDKSGFISKEEVESYFELFAQGLGYTGQTEIKKKTSLLSFLAAFGVIYLIDYLFD